MLSDPQAWPPHRTFWLPSNSCEGLSPVSGPSAGRCRALLLGFPGVPAPSTGLGMGSEPAGCRLGVKPGMTPGSSEGSRAPGARSLLYTLQVTQVSVLCSVHRDSCLLVSWLLPRVRQTEPSDPESKGELSIFRNLHDNSISWRCAAPSHTCGHLAVPSGLRAALSQGTASLSAPGPQDEVEAGTEQTPTTFSKCVSVYNLTLTLIRAKSF